MRKRTLLALTGILLALTSVASAHQQVVYDADDSDGPLDIVAADVRHRAGESKFRVITYDRFGLRKLDGPHSFFTFEIRHASIAGAERCIVIDAADVDGKLELTARIYNARSGCNYFDDQFVGTADARLRRERHALIVSVPNAQLHPNIRWRAVSAFERDGHEECPTPDPHGDGGYGACTDFTRWRTHTTS